MTGPPRPSAARPTSASDEEGARSSTAPGWRCHPTIAGVTPGKRDDVPAMIFTPIFTPILAWGASQVLYGVFALAIGAPEVPRFFVPSVTSVAALPPVGSL